MNNQTDNFIMLPTNDFCFKELMQNPNVRKGFVAAILKKAPEEIRETFLIPSETRKSSKDEKQGILDVRVLMEDGTQMDIEMQVAYFAYWDKRVLFYVGKMYTDQLKAGESYDELQKVIHVSILDFVHFPDDKKCYRKIRFCDVDSGKEYTDLFELHILELKKLPKEVKDGDTLLQWMKFLSGKNKEELEDMAEKNEYLQEAYQDLLKLSADDKKRMEYEAREKAIRDYNSQIKSATKQGIEIGETRGIKIGEERGEYKKLKAQVQKKMRKGQSIEVIAEALEESAEVIQGIIEELSKEE